MNLPPLFAYKMPVLMAFASMAYGFLYGLWPIAWIIIGAVFLYKISVKTGQFDIIRSSILSITEDQRLQMLLVGFSLTPRQPSMIAIIQNKIDKGVSS
jgi:L-lactate permease